MKKLDAITLEFARQVIEEETGAPLEIQVPSPGNGNGAHARPEPESNGANGGAANEARLIARDDRKNPLISTFDWTAEAAQRILRVPAGFMRSQTQERIEELARERAAARGAGASGEGRATIDLGLVEDGIEIGKRMMAEMIANYPSQGKSPGAATPTAHSATPAPEAPAPAAPQVTPAATGGGYLNEVSSVSSRRVQ
jgi:hypothetical protein